MYYIWKIAGGVFDKFPLFQPWGKIQLWVFECSKKCIKTPLFLYFIITLIFEIWLIDTICHIINYIVAMNVNNNISIPTPPVLTTLYYTPISHMTFPTLTLTLDNLIEKGKVKSHIVKDSERNSQQHLGNIVRRGVLGVIFCHLSPKEVKVKRKKWTILANFPLSQTKDNQSSSSNLCYWPLSYIQNTWVSVNDMWRAKNW